MNKQEITLRARRIVDERRFAAEDRVQRVLDELRQNEQYSSLERKLRQAQVDLAMGNGQEKALQKQITDCEKQLKALIATLGLGGALTPQYHCAKCHDTGYRGGIVCDCLQEEIRKLIVAESNVINRQYTFANSTEQNKHNLAVYKKARKVCQEGKQNVLLTGNTGSGKTYLLTACVNECLEQGKSVLLVTAYALNSTFVDAHFSDIATNQAILDSIVDVDVLAIDDLGTENIYKNITAEYFFSILNERTARGKQTFISTNLPLQGKVDEQGQAAENSLRHRYDERMFSRLVDQNTTFVAQLVGKDKRLSRQ
ncbi:MAG: ATP-binding protein [Clostridiales bacterium]|nr:ATP-binding protein [Clostridiales bacterium]